jgi:hypothetical protein
VRIFAAGRRQKPGYPLQSFLPPCGKKGFPLLSLAPHGLRQAVKQSAVELPPGNSTA